jgi:hypothetical protein
MIKSHYCAAQINNSYSKKLNTLLAIAVSITALTLGGYAHAAPAPEASTNRRASVNASGAEAGSEGATSIPGNTSNVATYA